MLKLLIKNGADISQAEYSHDGIYHTSLSKAVTEAHPHIVELLLIEGAGEDQQIGELNFGRYNSLQEYVKNEIEEYTKILAGNKYPENVRDLEYKINRYKKILKHLNDYEVPLINY